MVSFLSGQLFVLDFMPQQTDIIDAAFKRLQTLLAEVDQFAETLFTESDKGNPPPYVVGYE